MCSLRSLVTRPTNAPTKVEKMTRNIQFETVCGVPWATSSGMNGPRSTAPSNPVAPPP